MLRTLRILVTLMVVAVSATGLASPSKALAPAIPSNVEVLDTAGGMTQYRLKSNGMTILLHEDHAAPVFTFLVVYHVGSRNEAPGNTGSAHLLEHLLFNKSTLNFGRANGHKTFNEVLFEAGADFSSTNMTTWNDRMTGYSTLPSDKIEIAMKIEADRLGRGLILDSERQSEMSVVRNEYEIGENRPDNALWKAVIGAAVQAHPYHWDTIGYRSDIEGVSTDTLREHYRNYFHPDNAAAILVGDFDTVTALAMFDREFGGFERSKKPIPRVVTVEPPQEGERRVVISRPGKVGLVQLAYMRPGSLDPDFMALEVLASLVGDGDSSRLYRAVVDTGIGTDSYAANFLFRDPYPICFGANVSSDSNHQAVEDAIKKTLYEIGEKGVTAEELSRAKELIEVAVVKGREGTYNLASNLGEAIASANWKWFVVYLDGIRAVTADDVKRVAAKYLVPRNATVGWYVSTDQPQHRFAVADGAEENAAPPVAVPAIVSKASPAKSAEKTAPDSRRQTTRASFADRTVRKVLRNGIVVDVIENHAVPTVAIRGLLLAGASVAPSGKPAIPGLTAMMVQRGTKTRTREQISTLIDGAGARLTIDTNATEANINASGRSRDLQLLLDVLADEMRNPTFPADELAKAKSEMKNAVLLASESTTARGIERLTQVIYPEGHPYRAPGREALEASIEAATADDLRAFHGQRWNGSTLVIAIVGDVDAKKTIKLVEKLFAGLPKGKRPLFDTPRIEAASDVAREAVTMRGKANMNIMYGFASGLRRGDPDYDAALVANAALGQNALTSRIGKRVRDTEGLSYSLSSRFQLSDMLDGYWMVNVNVAPMNLAPAMKSTREEIERFRNEGATAEEVEVQKNFFAGNYNVNLGSNGGVAAALVNAEKFGFGPSFLDEFPRKIKTVTLEEVNAAIKSRFHADRLNLIVAGDLEEIP